MGKNVAVKFQECIKAGKIKASAGLNELANKELRVAIEHLYEGVIPAHLVEDFQMAKIMRENADHEENFSELGARKVIKSAENFLSFANGIVKKTS